jgi:hypothetical protein
VSADEERAAIGDYRENERYHHLTSYPLMEPPEAVQAADSVVGPSFDDPQGADDIHPNAQQAKCLVGLGRVIFL